VTFYIEVADAEVALAKAEELGGGRTGASPPATWAEWRREDFVMTGSRRSWFG
jgi:hypothetical protein